MNILKYLGETDLKKLKRTYEKGEFIHFEDEYCGGVYFLLSGTIEVSSTSLSGEKIIYNTISGGGMFGNHLAFSSDPYFRGDVYVKQKCEVIYLRRERLLDILSNNRAFLEEYLTIQSDFGKSLNARIKLLGFDSAEERLRYFLFLNKGRISFPSISSLAEGLHLKRETLSRLLSKLERQGVIKKDKHQITEIR